MKYRNTLIAAAVAALVPLAASNALAADSSKMGKHGAAFDALDTNRDGRISREEASADPKITFATADTNGDGYLDAKEFTKAEKMARKSGDTSSSDSTSPQPQSQSSYPNDASGQQTEPVNPTDPSSTEPTTPPTDTETPRQ